MKEKLPLFLLLFLLLQSKAQDQLATPQILNYTNEQYHAGIQNWDVAQDNTGRMYFGNNEGLLTYNGEFWNLYKLPNLTCVRSIEIDSENRIFVGGQDEIGYFFPDENGILKYHSLTPLIPQQYKKFADVWNVCILKNEIFFRTTNIILHYKDGAIKSYKPELQWEFAGKSNNKLFAHSKGKGLKVFDKGVWKPYCDDPVLNNSSITSIMEYNQDTLLVSTLKNGLFLMFNGQLYPKKTSLDAVFYNDRIYHSSKIDQDKYVIGTTSGGVFIINKNGAVLQKYSFNNGLQNNNVRGCITDKNKNLWLALDDGIDFIAINSSVKNIFPDKSKHTTSYAMHSFDGMLYIGTSNGLYATTIDLKEEADLSYAKASFKEVDHTKGQVWSLNEINNQLVMGHEDGFSVVAKNTARKVYSTPGTWLFEPSSKVFPSKSIIAGTYQGLQKIIYDQGQFSNAGKIEGLTESLRFIVFDDDNNLWASHPYHGVYRIVLKDDNKAINQCAIYTDKKGLPSHLYNYVFKIKSRIVVATEKGVYEYDALKDRFKPFSLLNDALSGLTIQYLKEDNNGNVWFITEKKVGVINFSNPDGKRPYTINYFSQLDGKVVGGFESIYFLNDKNVFIGANKGAYHINYSKYLENISRPSVVMGMVRAFGKTDRVVFGGYFTKNNKIAFKQNLNAALKLNKDFNSLHFEYASTSFEYQKNIEYSFQLVGFDKAWSPWIQKSEKDYTNLPAGKYTFNVKARNSIRNESDVVSYTFEVLPAWYQTVWMYLAYVFCLGIVIYLFFKWQKKTHLKAQERLRYLHQLEMDKTEKEIVRLEYEKLEADMSFKNRELSTMTMHLVQRGKVLAKVKEVISTVIKKHEINDSSPSFRHLIRLIRDVEKSDEDWDNFTMHFTHVNNNFFHALKDQFPELTPNELKLSAYLKMNLSTKEIAQLMNITIKAVEVGRYRLRKKLRLQPEINLFEFLNKFSRRTDTSDLNIF